MNLSFAERLKNSLIRNAGRLAVEGQHIRLTYADLDRESGTLARALNEAGVKAGDIVPLLIRRSPALVITQVALVRIGAAYAPIDLASPPARQRAMLEQIASPLVLTDSSSAGQELAGANHFNVDSFCGERTNCSANAKAESQEGFWHYAPPEAVAYVMFTSGTTGSPKGVLVPQSGITRLVCNAGFADFRADSRWGFLSSPAFDLSTLETWGPLLNGGCCVVQELSQPSLDDLATFLLTKGITDTWLTSSLFSAMVDDRPDAFSGLRQLLAGGERVSPRHARVLLETYPGLRLINGYGPTENTTFTLCHTIALADCDNAAGIPIGRPLRGTTVRIGTAEDESNAPPPTEGELLTGGEGVALGYLNERVLTAAKFVRVAGQRWYRTGDMVRQRHDGVFEFLGRVDRQIKLQGNRVELDEVERVLASCPGVGQCAVFVHGNAVENRHLVALYTGLGTPPPVEQVLEFLRAHLAPPAIPSRLMQVADIPRSTTGKADPRALAALIDGPSHTGNANGDSPPAPGASAAPAELPDVAMSDTEQQLLAIWQQYLPGVSSHRTASFLSSGGTSLLALQVSAQVRRKMGKNLTPIDVLRFPGLAEQARAIDAAAAFDFEGNDHGASELELPLTQVQRSMLAGTLLDESGSAYLVHVALHFAQPECAPDRSALQRAFAALAARHPALRMAVRDDGDSTHARVQPVLGPQWWTEHESMAAVPVDLTWPPELMRTVNRPLNLARDGVMRVDAWSVADGSLLLVWTVHHMAIDEASINRALFELDALLKGVALQPVYGSSLGFATFEKAWTNRDAVREWPELLIRALHGHAPRMGRAPGRGAEMEVRVPRATSNRFLAACARWGITPFAPLLVAYGQALQKVFGAQSRFVVTPFSRRTEAELAEPMGCLLDLNLVEAGTQPGETVVAALARTHRTVLELQQLQFLPNRAIGAAIAQRDSPVAELLNAFAFTWRINPSRTIPVGEGSARLLRVPQQGARFGVTLHAWLEADVIRCSVEALAGVVGDGRAAAVGQAFLKQLEVLADIEHFSEHADTHAVVQRTALSESSARVTQLRQAWSRWVGTPVDEIDDASDFLRCGGNSLTVMRMMTQLRREHGLRIGPGEFLARPTFQNLRALAGEPVSWSSEYGELIGAADAQKIVVFLPGSADPAIACYYLAREMQQQLGSSFAALILDLETMLLRAPAGQLLESIYERTEQVISELGWNRVVALVGYSSGGLLALEIARNAQVANRPIVWLLDSYAPVSASHQFLRTLFASRSFIAEARRAVAPLVRPLLRFKTVADALGTHVRAPRVRQVSPPPSQKEILQEAFHDRLYREWIEDPRTETHLVQATESAREVDLVWRRDTNGFNPRNHATLQVHHVPGGHNDIPVARASQIAELISARLRQIDNDGSA
jgi:amino acid adenylation domain-containing protein